MIHSLVPARLSEKLVFLYKFLQSPRQVGSIIPSSSYLAERMMQPINWQEARYVAELGAGTGVFTREIKKRINPDTAVLVFEQDSHMRRSLSQHFPMFSLQDDARKLASVVEEKGWPHLDAVVSGLPFANFPQELRDEIINGVVTTLRDGGLFITFQYSLQMKQQLEQRFSSVRTAFVPLNIPPAFVYICKK